MVPEFRLAASQRMSMNTLLHRAVKLLQLPSLDFKMEIERLASENPFLSLSWSTAPSSSVEHPERLPVSDPWSSEPGPGVVPVGAAPSSCPNTVDLAPMGWTPSQCPGQIRAPRSERPTDTDWDRLSESVVGSDIRAHLVSQVQDLPLSDRMRQLVLAVVYSLDDDGYFRDSSAGLAASLPLEWGARAEDIDRAVEQVQALEPSGVGARNLSEYLALQLWRCDAPSNVKALAVRACTHHLSLLASHEYGRLARELGVGRDDVLDALALVLSLRPRIEIDTDVGPEHFIVPDVTVSNSPHGLVVDMNRGLLPQVVLNEDYIGQIRQQSLTRSDRMNVSVAEARWVVRLVDQRLRTILEVATVIAKRQREFFAVGEMALKPMTLRDVAQELGMHESTVCRVTNGKYVATPRGVFELKRFFSREIVTDSGHSCSAGAVRGLVKSLLEGADRPLSDAEVAIQLATQGIRISRRTVTKYRNALGLSPVALQRVQRRRAYGR